MAKETTYQRLKRENQKLKQELREVCTNPTSMKSIQIITRQEIIKKQEDIFLMGSPTTEPISKRPGFINFIINPTPTTISSYDGKKRTRVC